MCIFRHNVIVKDNVCTVTATYFSANGDFTDNGELFGIKLKVRENAEPGEYAVGLKIKESDVCNNDLALVPFDTVDGSIEIAAFVYGDIFVDGVIDICTCGGYIHGCRLRQSTCGGFAGIHRFVCAVTRFLIGEIKSEYFGCIAGIVRAEQNTELHILHVSSRAATANDKHICVCYINNLSFSLRCRCF